MSKSCLYIRKDRTHTHTHTSTMTAHSIFYLVERTGYSTHTPSTTTYPINGLKHALCNAARARAAPDRVAKPPPPDVYICYRVWFITGSDYLTFLPPYLYLTRCCSQHHEYSHIYPFYCDIPSTVLSTALLPISTPVIRYTLSNFV